MIRRPVWDVDSSTILKNIMNDGELAEWQEVQRINAETHELILKVLIARQVQAEIRNDQAILDSLTIFVTPRN